jgi:biotin transport system substrate-specific component
VSSTQTATNTAPPQRPQHRNLATDLALVSTFAALIAVCALIPAIPVGPVPITLQTFAVSLSGAVLGAKRGFLAALLYLALGAAGLPIFSGGSAGIAPFTGPTVGYLIAFPLAAGLAGFFVERLPRHRIATSIPLIFISVFGANLIFIHTLGPLGLALRTDMGIQAAYAFGFTFWPGDIIKSLLVAIVATAVHRAFPEILPRRKQPTPQGQQPQGQQPQGQQPQQPSQQAQAIHD